MAVSTFRSLAADYITASPQAFKLKLDFGKHRHSILSGLYYQCARRGN
jgi:hypothetical protein